MYHWYDISLFRHCQRTRAHRPSWVQKMLKSRTWTASTTTAWHRGNVSDRWTTSLAVKRPSRHWRSSLPFTGTAYQYSLPFTGAAYQYSLPFTGTAYQYSLPFTGAACITGAILLLFFLVSNKLTYNNLLHVNLCICYSRRRVMGVKRSSTYASVCLSVSVCMIEPKRLQSPNFTWGQSIISAGYPFNIKSKGQRSRSQGHKVQKHILVEGDCEIQSIKWPASNLFPPQGM